MLVSKQPYRSLVKPDDERAALKSSQLLPTTAPHQSTKVRSQRVIREIPLDDDAAYTDLRCRFKSCLSAVLGAFAGLFASVVVVTVVVVATAADGTRVEPTIPPTDTADAVFTSTRVRIARILLFCAGHCS